MKKLLVIILICVCSSTLYSQTFSLSKERVNNIKNATVKIIVNGGQSTGTGFFINESGLLVTCYHVVAAIANNPNSIYEAQFANGEKIKIGFTIVANNISYLDNVLMYDFILMQPVVNSKINYSFLNLGKWEDVQEGDLTYTCGYPLGIDQQFISVGVMSTKFKQLDTLKYTDKLKKPLPFTKNSAWLDLRLNRGNSGGAIVLVGKTPSDDRVIGIADFILNPFAASSDKLIKKIMASRASGGYVELMGVDPNETALIFAQTLDNVSLGVSGCLSIEYVNQILNKK
jgi:S1-C subfamily serine protease